MKIEVKEIYFCEYCNKLYQRKHACLYHEKLCFKNPDNVRPCFDCEYLIMKDCETTESYYDGYGERESIVKKSLFYCDEKKWYLYPPKVEIKNNFIELGDEQNLPMPRKCDEQSKCNLDFDYFKSELQL